MTGTENLFGSPVAVANEMKDRIHHELGFTVNIGISTNKVLAKMAVDEIRNRFGKDAIKRGTFVTGKIDHLSGGITREK